MTSMHWPSDIATALRLLADNFDDAPDTRLPQLRVTVTVQVAADSGTDAQRIAAVDLLTFAALGLDADLAPLRDGAMAYGTPLSGPSTEHHGATVNVFTALTDAVDAARPAGGTRHLAVVRAVAA